MNRREFLQRAALGTTSFVLTAPAWAPAAATGAWVINAFEEERKEPLDVEAAPPGIAQEKDHRLTETNYPETNFTNVGVIHMKSMWEAQGSRVVTLINEADIVLLEKGPFFDALAQYAHTLNKQVERVDDQSMTAQIFATLLSFEGLLRSIGLTRDAMKNTATREAWLKRYALLLGIAELGVFPPTLIASAMLTSDHEYPLKYDISFTGDGRTVLMLERIKKVMQENPGKRIVSITGNYHAKGFDHYFKDEHAGELATKRMLYEIVYFLHISAAKAESALGL